LTKSLTLRRHQDTEEAGRCACHRIDRGRQRLRPHHHSAAAAIRRVIHLPITAQTVLAQIVGLNRKEALAARTADQAGIERREHFGKQRDHVKLHRG
jgi:hypothetical protein